MARALFSLEICPERRCLGRVINEAKKIKPHPAYVNL
jgi:hypothetical protein